MKKCPFCDHPVGEASILCPVCKKIITEPERGPRQKHRNLIFGAIIVFILLGISTAVYFALGTTPVSTFLKGNAVFFQGVVKTETPLLNRLMDETFKTDFQFTLHDACHVPSQKTGDLNIDISVHKSKYDAALAVAWDLDGFAIDKLIAFNKGKKLYIGRPAGGQAYATEMSGSDHMLLTDRVPTLLTQFNTKEEFLRFLQSIYSLLAESIESQYVQIGKGTLISRVDGKAIPTDTVSLNLDPQGFRGIWMRLEKKFSETPAAYDGLEKMFGNFTNGKTVRETMEKDLADYFHHMPDDANLNWTVHSTGKTPVAVEIKYTGQKGVYRLWLQNELHESLNHLHIVYEVPPETQNGETRLDFDIQIETNGDYIQGKGYDIRMNTLVHTGSQRIEADVQASIMLRQLSAAEYKTTGEAFLKLIKDGITRTYDFDCSLSYNFVDLKEPEDSPELPLYSIMEKAKNTPPETFLRQLLDTYGQPFLLDDFTDAA